jgi:hypothetical protein
MTVRIKYLELGNERGLSTWVPSKEALLQRLKELGIDVQTVFSLEIKEKGQYKSFDPSKLKHT